MTARADLAVIAAQVPVGARILDVGCGDGALMAMLRDSRRVESRGLEIDPENVAAAIGRGLAVVQGDADTDLVDYPDASFDCAILSQTLQSCRAPDKVLAELLRIGRRAFVSFPNFGHWRARASLLARGRVPATAPLAGNWYDTPDIRRLTIRDFRALARARGVVVERAWFLAGGRCIAATGANLFAEQAIFQLSGRNEPD